MELKKINASSYMGEYVMTEEVCFFIFEFFQAR